MDEFSRVISQLMSQGGAPAEAEGGAKPSELPPLPTEAAEAAPAAGGLDLMGLIGGMSAPPQGHRMELLLALKPYLNPKRCDKVDRACSLVRTAYMIRGALGSVGTLSSLGGTFNV